MAAPPARHASVGGVKSQTLVKIIQRVCLEVASALNREEVTRGAGSLIDSLESGKPDVEGGGGGGRGVLMSWPDVADPCHSAERRLCPFLSG